ncbi:hypothetical protein M378DRAFT_168790 [Amanita muscaria Koide BX008]|uniref:Uncharacterized protein n=1 Tax=Amanita muscaria (strain Koide BX008) TaxID=946122 RepID=A0A0C2SAE7_AMAMK|nr:hypothetical protein M378DRAFT_168790 [Amanita muscaria Koide BX008]
MARPVHQHQPPVGFQPDENLLTPTFLPSHSLPRSTSAHSLSRSNHSSFSFDIQVESPSQPSTPRESDESASGQDSHYLSPNGSRPVSLPRVQPQPQPHESPVLPVLPRIVPQPTEWGTPAVRPLDLASAVYEEAPTPPGFQYPTPLGAAISGGVGGKSMGKGVTLPQSPAGGGPSLSPYYASSPYVSKPDRPDSSSVSTSQQPVVPPVTPKTSSLSSSSSTSSSQQPVVPPVTPNVGIYQGSQLTGNRGNGYHRNEGDDEEGEEDTSFDSATKRNTQWNSRMYRR